MKAPDLARIDTATLAVLLRSGVAVQLLDARGGNDDIELIPGADRLGVKTTAEEVEAVVEAKDRLLVTYCTTLHCPLSMGLYEHLKNLGYENVLDYPDGVDGWKAAGYPTEEG
jgi:rhodanese-related sulfurtransferase